MTSIRNQPTEKEILQAPACLCAMYCANLARLDLRNRFALKSSPSKKLRKGLLVVVIFTRMPYRPLPADVSLCFPGGQDSWITLAETFSRNPPSLRSRQRAVHCSPNTRPPS